MVRVGAAERGLGSDLDREAEAMSALTVEMDLTPARIALALASARVWVSARKSALSAWSESHS